MVKKLFIRQRPKNMKKKNTISPITKGRDVKTKLLSKASRIGSFKKLTVS